MFKGRNWFRHALLPVDTHRHPVRDDIVNDNGHLIRHLLPLATVILYLFAHSRIKREKIMLEVNGP